MNTLKAYFDRIKKIPLLTAEEEIELAKKIEKGDKEARNKMIKVNLRLVVSIAKRYMNLGMSLSDLVEEGNLGLIKAVNKYDYHRGNRFSTFADWWIKAYIIRAIGNQGRAVRIPEYITAINNHIHKVTDELTQKLQHIPTGEELSKELKISIEEINNVKEIMQENISLNETIEIDINHKEEFIDFITYKNNPSLVEELPNTINYNNIVNILSQLTEQEIEMIKMRFGLEDYKLHTLEEIGNHYTFTKQATSLAEIKLINKFKSFFLVKNLIETKDIQKLVAELEVSLPIKMAYIRLEQERRKNKLPKRDYQFEELIIKVYEILCRIKNVTLREQFRDYFKENKK